MFGEQSTAVAKNGSPAERARILIVEDQPDVRRLLVTALEIEGHDVDEASNAREGLERLQQTRYDLILTDYAMPGGTGTWMLHEAARRGLTRESVALIITAHPDVSELSDVEVINKPVDLDQFVEQVRRLLAARYRRVAQPDVERQDVRSTPHKIELILYVSSASPASLQALRNLDRLLTRYDSSQVKVTVHDLGRTPQAGEADHVAFTPTLVKTFPEPRMWVLGNLRDPEVLEELLRVCGVDGK